MLYIKKCIFIISIIITLMLSATTSFAVVLKNIVINGNGRLSKVAIETIISYRIGDNVGKAIEAIVIQELYATQKFKNVSARLSGSVLYIKLVENAIVNDFEFEGNKIIADDDLIDAVGVKIRSVSTKDSLKLATYNLTQLYKSKGYYSITIEPSTVAKSNNRVNYKFKITENQVATITKIDFKGNKLVSRNELLSVIISIEDVWWKFFSDDDIYDKGRIEVDRQLIENYYHDEGFVDARVVDVKVILSKDKKEFNLKYIINEGKRHKLNKIFVGKVDKKYNLDKINLFLKDAQKGGYVFTSGLNRITTKITTEILNQGFPFIDVVKKLRKTKNKNGEDIINVEFRFKNGRKLFIERIVIRGNTRTLDKVIRREMEFVEGDPLNATLIRNSQRNVIGLGYFKDVKLSFENGSDPKNVVVYVDVQETSTGSLGFSGGYSDDAGIIYRINSKERNFLGRGQVVNLALTKSDTQRSASFSITQPKFLNRNMSASFSVGTTLENYLKDRSYEAKNIFVALSMNYRINRNWGQGLSLKYKDYDLFEVKDDASRGLLDQKGRTKSFTISHSLIYSDLNNRSNPTEGIKISMRNRLVGLGSKYTNFYNSLTGGYFYPLRENIIFNLVGTIANISSFETLRYNDRIYLGSGNVRGFDSFGPKDKTSNDLIGGTLLASLMAEIDFPIGFSQSSGVKGVLFTGAGRLSGTPKYSGDEIVGEKEIRTSVGIGVKWASPVGPIRFDFSKVINKALSDKTKIFQLSLGFGF